MKILCITEQFPYGKGEQFLESELPVLAEKIDELHVIPYRMISGDRRPIPKGVYVHEKIVDKIEKLLSKRVKRAWAYYVFLLRIGVKEIVILHKNYRRIKPNNKKWVKFFCIRAHALAEMIEQEIPLDTIDVVYSFWLTESAYAAVILKRKYPHLQIISRAHGYDLFSERQNVTHRPYQKETTEGLDAVYSVSGAGALYLKKKYPSLSHKVETRYLGLQRKVACAGSKDNVLRIASCANLIPLKRIHLIAEALQMVNRPVEWVHIGDGPEMHRIQSIAEKLPLHISCNFRGSCPNSEVISYYQSHPVDVFINCSEIEALPVSIMEAMSFGIPCIGTDVGGVSEIINTENGWLLHKEFNPVELARILEEIDTLDTSRRVSAQMMQRTFFNAQTNYGTFLTS